MTHCNPIKNRIGSIGRPHSLRPFARWVRWWSCTDGEYEVTERIIKNARQGYGRITIYKETKKNLESCRQTSLSGHY